ncbi:Solute carrier family 10 member 6 [Fasciola gigantica]|uniref:Solute carrier family 10 member 6 n=1 Tax=Fasciola gigantica TaxID=46835 RepID=A0A504ZBX8_FASGI|nr:Solute carrier family 10 member 6 [Fasciola gigantica]
MAWPIWSLWLLFFISASYCVPSPDITRSVEFGLEHTEVKVLRERFEQNLLGDESNATSFEQTCRSSNNKTVIRIRISKDNLKMFDNSGSRQFPVVVEYSSDIPIHVFYDLDSAQAAQLSDVRWYWLPPEVGAKLTIPLNITAKQIGLSYVRFWIGEGVPRTDNVSLSWPVNNSEDSMKEVIAGLNSESTAFRDSEPIGFPLMVLRAQGVVQLVFRIMVVVMVSIFTFTMGCGLDIAVMKAYAKRPVCPAIGFGCQFIIMPLVAFAIAKLVPIKQEFGFGLLTVGCSPGGGASNAWSLMLGGDINLSIIMTFISSLSCLFMMPLLLFIFGRFFIDVNRVSIPYGSIALQLLQITTPAMLGLGLRAWKPKIAVRLKHLTRPMFLFFIVFFLTFGIYANLSIFSLIWSYPIVMPTSALLPWLGFGLSALATFLLRQSRAVIVTVALETGIQNVGAAILVLLYSMTQPAGDLGAVMPITVSIFTPVPLYFALLGLTIKRRCCTAKRPPTELHETQALRGNVDEEGEKQAQYATEERKNGLISLAMTTDPHTVDVRPTVHPDGDTISI